MAGVPGPLEDGHQLRAVSVPNVPYPLEAYISGSQAARVCAAAGMRLCAPVEWRKACEGPKNQKFGYGNEPRGRAERNDAEATAPCCGSSRRSPSRGTSSA